MGRDRWGQKETGTITGIIPVRFRFFLYQPMSDGVFAAAMPAFLSDGVFAAKVPPLCPMAFLERVALILQQPCCDPPAGILRVKGRSLGKALYAQQHHSLFVAFGKRIDGFFAGDKNRIRRLREVYIKDILFI
jgi:hypothetical protein